MSESASEALPFYLSVCLVVRFYAWEQLLLSAHLSHCSSVRLSVCPSVCHTGPSVKSGASWNHQIFTIGCL